MLTRRTLPPLIALALPALAAPARADDASYCRALSELGNHYLITNTGDGRAMPDLNTAIAIDECRKGNFAAGIPVLEQKLRNNGFTLPKR
jgi:hypothetical protein